MYLIDIAMLHELFRPKPSVVHLETENDTSMNNYELSCINGPNLALRLVQPEDAEYIHTLRSDIQYNAHLSAVQGTAGNQRKWIVDYKAREEVASEFYYVIERHDGVRCGVVRLYDITQDSFTWGSWILDHNKPRKAALESAYLLYDIAFTYLQLQKAVFQVRRENNRTLAFHQRFGAIQTHIDAKDIYFTYSREQFENSKVNFKLLLEFPDIETNATS